MKSTVLRSSFLLFLVLLLMNQYCSRESDQLGTWYDPARDPFSDLTVAIDLAQQSDKRILLEVGGDWCKWCHILEEFLKEQAEIMKSLHDHYVLLKVNYSRENENAQFLSHYPKIPGYPHIFILDANGKFLHSQDTADLESGQSYDPVRMMDFIQKWAGSGHAE